MKEEKIKKVYQEKIKEFQKHNYLYFEKNAPILNDAVFDKLKQEILNLEKKYPSFKDKNSPSLSVGFKPSKIFKKVPHKSPMLSLGNAFSEEDLLNFEKKIFNFLNLKKDFKYLCSNFFALNG